MLKLFCAAANDIANDIELEELLFYARIHGVVAETAKDACEMLNAQYRDLRDQRARRLPTSASPEDDDLLLLHFDPMRLRVHRSARVSTVDNMGLFARSDIPIGQVVVQMERPMEATEASVIAHGFPGDTGFSHGRKYVWDSAFKKPDSLPFDSNRPESAHQHIPLWWRMNHAPSRAGNPVGAANVFPRYVREGATNTFRFVAKRKIAAGEELLITYGDVPREWDRESDKRRRTARA